jgi:hypothetical protein
MDISTNYNKWVTGLLNSRGEADCTHRDEARPPLPCVTATASLMLKLAANDVPVGFCVSLDAGLQQSIPAPRAR